MEERSSNFFSSSPNFPNPNLNNISFFTHQAIRAGLSSRDPRRQEFNPNPTPYRNFYPNNIRESIRRELEKERIRAEIIAEEGFRRRVLEEEVRRELTLEREMAMRRGKGGFEFGVSAMRLGSPRVPLLANIEHRIGFSPNREVGFQGSQVSLPFQRDPIVAGNFVCH